MKHCIAGVIGAIVAFSASASVALTLNFGGGSDNLDTISFPETDGISLTVTGFSDYADGTAGDIHRNGTNGWGIGGNPDRNWLGANGSRIEALVLTFSRSVSLESLIMTERGNNDSAFSLLDGTNNSFGRFVVGNGSGPATFDLESVGVQGTTFVILGDQQGGGVRLSGLTFSAVPLPAPVALLLAALAWLGFTSRRKRRQAQPLAA